MASKCQRHCLSLLMFLSMVMVTVSAKADVPTFDNITESQLESITEEFGASFSHTSVASAASLGTIFGLEAALIGGVVQSDAIEEIVNSVSPGTDFGAIPHASLLISGSLPFGITGEVTFIPSFDIADIELERLGLAVKWTITETLLSLPVDLAIKGHLTDAKLGFTQSSPDAEVEFESTVIGASVIVSRSFLLVEPYAGVGFVNIDGKLSGSVSIFDNAFTTGTEAENESSGAEYFVGVQANLLILRAAVEYGRVLDNDKISAKIGLKF